MKYVKDFLKKFEFIAELIGILKRAYLCLESLVSVMSLMMVFMFMFSMIACEAFYIEESKILEVENDPILGPVTIYFKNSGFGTF